MKIKNFITIFFLIVFSNSVAQTPVLQPKSVIEMDFEKESKLFDFYSLKLKQNPQDSSLTEEVFSLGIEYKESFWDIFGDACSWYCAGGPFSVTASSSLKSNGKNSYDGQNAHDLDYKNAWVEGVSGYGIGEYLLYKFKGDSPRVTEIIVVNGYVKSRAAFKNNSRVKKLKVYKDDKPIAILELKDIMGEQTFDIGTLGYHRENAPDWSLKFEIMEVYEGEKYDDTAISEIYFQGLDVHCLAKGTKIAMADGSEKNIEDIEAGDKVLSYSAGKGMGESSVKSTASKVHSDFVCYKFRSGKELICTPDHPLFCEGFGWVSSAPEKTKVYKGYRDVLAAKPGMQILSDKGIDTIDVISKGTKEQVFFTIEELEDGQMGYFANGLCVGTEPLR